MYIYIYRYIFKYIHIYINIYIYIYKDGNWHLAFYLMEEVQTMLVIFQYMYAILCVFYLFISRFSSEFMIYFLIAHYNWNEDIIWRP